MIITRLVYENSLLFIHARLLQDLLRTAETASHYHFDRQKSIGINWNTVTNSLGMCANLQGNTGLA